MSGELARVLKLIELATAESANPNEAREAAVAAVRMIKKHGLRVVGDDDFDFDGVFAKVGQSVADEMDGFARERAGMRGNRGKGSVKFRGDCDTLISAQAAGFCAACGDTYRKGERVVWQAKDRTIVHRSCQSTRRGMPRDIG